MIEQSYDEMPYYSLPIRGTHPDSMAVVARLMGLNHSPITKCRVLEIGCSTGGNLLPMAINLPGSQFVGIDLSSVQIQIAKQSAQDLGVKNVEYRAMSLTDLTPADGLFDYIICHGVYSWVPTFVQDKILEVCSKNLAPNGVAYISYNTLPGWYMRQPVRESMLYFLKRVSKPESRVPAARDFLNFLIRSAPDPKSVYTQMLTNEFEILQNEADYYVAHEHLDSDNRPCYFSEFIERVTPHGLQFLGNADPECQLSEFSEEVQSSLPVISRDLIEVEQFIDLIIGRMFRRTLLCHQNVKLNRTPEVETVLTFLLSAGVKPKASEPSANPMAFETFQMHRGKELTSNDPTTKALFWHLWRAWPNSLTAQELLAKMEAQFGANWAPNAEASTHKLASLILHGYLNRTIGLNTDLPKFTTERSDKPIAWEYARYMARRSDKLPTLRHMLAQFNNLDRYVLCHLDGNHTRDQVIAEVQSAIDRKVIPAIEGSVAAAVDDAMRRIGDSAMYVG
jgi:methyltransferase-like protein/ubiquinone/menaquinone biosynthesis C-methylase UbiE